MHKATIFFCCFSRRNGREQQLQYNIGEEVWKKKHRQRDSVCSVLDSSEDKKLLISPSLLHLQFFFSLFSCSQSSSRRVSFFFSISHVMTLQLYVHLARCDMIAIRRYFRYHLIIPFWSVSMHATLMLNVQSTFWIVNFNTWYFSRRRLPRSRARRRTFYRKSSIAEGGINLGWNIYTETTEEIRQFFNKFWILFNTSDWGEASRYTEKIYNQNKLYCEVFFFDEVWRYFLNNEIKKYIQSHFELNTFDSNLWLKK